MTLHATSAEPAGPRDDDAGAGTESSPRLRELASLPVALPSRRAPRVVDRLRPAREAVEAVYKRLAEAPRESVAGSRAAEWLLDNHYIVSRAFRLLLEEFPDDFDRRLPRFVGDSATGHARSLAGVTRIFAVAAEVEAAGKDHLDPAATQAAVHEFQSLQPLTIAEVWALPAIWRLIVLERLAKAATAIAPERAAYDASSEEAIVGTVARCIRDLRTLETTDWKPFVEGVSVIDTCLRADPADVYASMDFDTRDRYRKAIEDVAEGCASSEPEVAAAAVRLASAAEGRAAHVGYWLIDAGRPALEQAVGSRPRLGARFLRALKAHATAIYLGTLAALTGLLLGGLAVALWAAGTGAGLIAVVLLLASLPSSAVATYILQAALTRIMPPSVLPKMDYERGLPDELVTLVAVPCLLTRHDEIDALARSLEIRFLANEDEALRFALLTDFGDAAEASTAADTDLVKALAARLEGLNQRYGSRDRQPFFLIHRPRRWCETQNCWMGWERKRGKLHELNGMLLGDATGAEVVVGDASDLSGVRYVLTLDADTELPRGAARRLVATLAHPLNRAEVDFASGAVTAGYTVLQPRIEISPAAIHTRFARWLADSVGLDPYTHAVSDVYQDFFGEGVFAGKGIYDVAAFERSLAGRVPEGALLSHDLFEGVHGRAGLVTDVVLIEDCPEHYLGYAHRLHRWARGDWQLLPWLGRRVPLATGGRTKNRLSLISRWKIADNLRRTLVAPSLLAFLIASWLWLPEPIVLWTLLAILVPATPMVIDVLMRLTAALAGGRDSPRLRLTEAVHSALLSRAWLVEIAFLPHQAALLCDAMLRTWWRLFVSRRRLLEWTSAAHISRNLAAADTSWRVWIEMFAAPASAAALAVGLVLLRPQALIAAAPLLALWLVSPFLADWVSRPLRDQEAQLSAKDLRRLRLLARRTWSFFETYGGPEEQWLPPDHFQEDPGGIVARRTSPTNIGLLLVATLSAYDFGYRGLLWTVLRVKNVLDTLDRMERYRGHFLNWVGTATLEPLPPRYVSTVDSGNLVACLLTLEQACVELLDRPVIADTAWSGLIDTIDALDAAVEAAAPRAPEAFAVRGHLDAGIEDVERFRQQPAEWGAGLEQLTTQWGPELERRLVALLEAKTDTLAPAILADLRRWSMQVSQHLDRLRREIELFQPWIGAMARPPALLADGSMQGEAADFWRGLQSKLAARPSLQQLPSACDTLSADLERLDSLVATVKSAEEPTMTARKWIAALRQSVAAAREMALYLSTQLDEVRQRSGRFAHETDFGLLYDKRRRLFFIGYNVDAGRLDEHHYDLLASEARLASFVAIAKGDVPQEHWLHLGRPIGTAGGERTLLSWSGTMFEFLMPPLLLREGRETLIGLSSRAAVHEQIAYAARRGIPWGISESGYARFDALQNYQYRAFGVPSLGFRRGVDEDLVVAPYASMIALRFAPAATMENLAALEELGAMGPHGLYEAVDFTWSRLQPGRRYTLVRSFMAHHQGMILASLNNFLNGDPLVERFHATALARTAELLLLEAPPRRVPIEQAQPPVASPRPAARRRPAMGPWTAAAQSPAPQAHVLSNGRYTVLTTAAGGGFSRWNEVALTRWTPDATLDADGFRLYIQEDGGSWQTIRGAAGLPGSEVFFHPHMVELHARHQGIALRESITVAPGADLEIRLVTLTNEGDEARTLWVTGYGEPVLDDANGDRRHPAFSKLFVQSEYIADLDALLFFRRRREPRQRQIFLVHRLVLPRTGARVAGHDAARDRFLGRGSSPRAPTALASGRPSLLQTTGATLDSAMVLSTRVELRPRGTRRLAFVTAVGESREAALALASDATSLSGIEWNFELARNHAEAELVRTGLDSPALAAVQRLLSLLLYSHRAKRAPFDVLQRNTLGRSGLWRFSISGDLPILLVRLPGNDTSTGCLLDVLRAHNFWRGRGIAIDLVILNERASSYSAELTDRLARLIASTGGDSWVHRRGGIFVVHADQVNEAERVLLLSSARVVLDAAGGSLAQQTAWRDEASALPPLAPTAEIHPSTSQLDRPTDLLFDNGFGGFSADGREYVVHLEPGQQTPAPWVNVVANPAFGFTVSEMGSGYTWAANSGENRLTPWRNDPVADPPSEAIYLRDEETAALWTPTPGPTPAAAAYQIRHGAGYTEFAHRSHDLDQRLRLFVPPDDPLKIVRLTLTNTADRPRRITATFYVEWLLGSTRDGSEAMILPSFDLEAQALLARQPANEAFAERVAFAAAASKLHGFTGDRAEFLGHGGTYARPAGLVRIGFANAVGPGLDPCAALQVHFDLAPGETQSTHFLLGQGRDAEEATRLVRQYRPAASIEAAWEAVRVHWDDLLGAAQVHTPDAALDLMLNRWLLYQTVSSRFWGRTGFYQSSGAFGFRDQLQDVGALVHVAPELYRSHLLECARHQFAEGDVLHWWHPPMDTGVRTRCSDDLLWLPYATAHYVEATGDADVLGEEAPFLGGEVLRPSEHERYGRFASAGSSGSLYEHCLRALRHGHTVGPHGLPLFGSGDWNDGMNRVGERGRGESVWLGWFRLAVLRRFADLCEQRGDASVATDLRREAEVLHQAIEAHAWDGEWYLRGYYDDGSRLGSAERDECRIDSIAQSWAVLSGAGNRERAQIAMASVRRHLLRDDRLLLFTPPFDRSRQDPGYVRAYPPGVRENGGQYTHAAVWALWALIELGEVEAAFDAYVRLLPIAHARTREAAQLYRVEPYALAADVYGAAPHTGRGGWTWYTGSAGWAYRFGWEALLGIRCESGGWRFEPRLPAHWPGFEATLRQGRSVFEIRVDNPDRVGRGVAAIKLDGRVLADAFVPRIDDGATHRVEVTLGSPAAEKAKRASSSA